MACFVLFCKLCERGCFAKISSHKGKSMDLFNELKKLKILLIDDDELIRDSLALFFETEGCHLTTLATAEEGLKAFRLQDYDIIIADYRLPGMDGLDFLKRIQNLNSRAIKILITAYGSKEIIAEANKLGIQDFIEKPFTSDIIESSLSSLIKAHKLKK